jgi:hypothetical protein
MGPGEHRRVSDPGQALKRVVEVLDRAAISYLVGDSIASGIHGVYRTSLDVDLVADLHPQQSAGLAKQLSGEFYADADMMRDALRAGRSFNLIHFASSYKFDIFPLLSDSYHQMQFSRRVVRDIILGSETLAVPIATAEDTVLMKLVWYRSGGEVSERQWNDVRGIVAVQGERLDRAYIAQWAAYLKVADLAEQALGLG